MPCFERAIPCLMSALALASAQILSASPAIAQAPQKTAVSVKTSKPVVVDKASAPGKTAEPADKKLTPSPSKASGPAAPGWELQQWHRMAGRMRLVSNKYGGKFETTHYTLLKPMPGEAMYFLNQQTKRYVLYAVKDWQKKFNFYHKDPGRTKDAGFTDFSPWKHVGDDKIVGLKVGKYTRMRTNNLPAPNDKTYTEEWSFCRELKVPPSLIDLYKKTLSMTYDEKLGFPMRVTEIREWSGKKAKKVDLSYDTLSYKKASFPQKFFEMGADYKKVKDEMSVLMDEGGDMMGGDMPGADGTGAMDINAELKKRLK